MAAAVLHGCNPTKTCPMCATGHAAPEGAMDKNAYPKATPHSSPDAPSSHSFNWTEAPGSIPSQFRTRGLLQLPASGRRPMSERPPPTRAPCMITRRAYNERFPNVSRLLGGDARRAGICLYYEYGATKFKFRYLIMGRDSPSTCLYPPVRSLNEIKNGQTNFAERG
jgi:hypothetical protein